MVQSVRAKTMISEIDREETKRGDLKKARQRNQKDHDLALELWASGKSFSLVSLRRSYSTKNC